MLRRGDAFSLVRQEVHSLVDTDQDLVVANPQSVAVGELAGTALGNGQFRVVDVHAVGAGVPQDKAAAAMLDVAMVAGDDPSRIRQDPVVVRGPAYGPPIHAKDPSAAIA